MTENKKDSNAQEKGFNSTAAYGDPKKEMHEKPDPAELRDNENSPFDIDPDGNVSTGGSEVSETGAGIQTGQRTGDMASPNDNLTDIAETGRNRGNVPLRDRQIDDVPANDPNAADAGPVNTEARGEGVRKSASVKDDLASIDVSRRGLPGNDQVVSDVPPADPAINDVPDADRSMRESPEHLSQNAADHTRRKDSGE